MGIDFDRAEIQDLPRSRTREWLVTNGLGGYASGTLPGLNTRRYHGLLVAAVRPPVQRVALLVRLDEVLTVGDETVDLMTAEYQEEGTLYPEGFRQTESFALDEGVPTWHFAVRDSLLRRTVWMVPNHNITVVRYKLAVGREPVELALRPLCAARDHHSVQHGNLEWRLAVEPVADGVRVQAAPDAPALWLLARGASFRAGGDWYWNFLLREERERGYDHLEDLYQPGTFRAILSPGASLTLIASAEDPAAGLPDPDVALAAVRSAHARAEARGRGTSGGGAARILAPALATAAEAFVVHRAPNPAVPGEQISVVAGYHWFTDWGRDAMIALRGLLLLPGRVDEAATLLRTFAAYINQGMVPNRFPDTAEIVEYNTCDASVWFFQALHATLQAGAGDGLLRDLFPKLKEIIDWHRRGTRYGIAVDPEDGLLHAGEANPGGMPTQLTWMDARCNDLVVTPRVGKPVEINALWIDALSLMGRWAPRCGEDGAPYLEWAAQARASFGRRFWYEAGGYLYDVVDGPDGDDASLRPNQLIALALEQELVTEQQMRSALDAVTAKLLTPYGLRSLSPDDPRYKGQCVGDQPTRDLAYHQGTVWTWLLGPYADALRRLDGQAAAVEPLLEPFVAHLRESGIGSVSEVFDGDAPHTPRGCIAQGWSVAELFRIAHSPKLDEGGAGDAAGTAARVARRRTTRAGRRDDGA